MMAGTGVSAGGAGMLRARRRDVSVKPNRKLDRKSSRGMIYENEELRLRTIHINAEVEQGQNDIKKLRRENEQLRREIWSLRDEYDKLEDILKSQKHREGSEDYEDRSEGEDKDDDEEIEEHSDCSGEEDDEEAEECDAANDDDTIRNASQEKQDDQEERLENAENQKISSEKMNNSLHRLHVEFDDLSVVDEEEELKKEKDRREPVPLEEQNIGMKHLESGTILMDRSGHQCFPTNYGSPGVFTSGHPYYPDCPFVFPNSKEVRTTDILPMDPNLMTACPGGYDEEHPSHLCNTHLAYGPSVGWQNSIFPQGAIFPTSENYQSSIMAAQASAMCLTPMYAYSNESDQSSANASTVRATSTPRATPIKEHASDNNPSNLPSLSQRRNVFFKQPTHFFRDTIIPRRETEAANSAEALSRNGWDFSTSGGAHSENRGMFSETENDENTNVEKAENGSGRFEDSTRSGTILAGGADRPKHFFAPLPTKIQHSRQDSNDKTTMRSTTSNPNDSPSAMFFESYGTGQSSSSDRTNSTVVSAKHLQCTLAARANGNFSDGTAKGSADICVNGAIPAPASNIHELTSNDQRSYKSTENLLIENNRDSSRGNSSSRQGSNTPLIKSLSCQDLTSEQLQNSLYDIAKTFNCERSQKFAKSDNTLDNSILVDSSKPFKSQLNVTLKLPGRMDHRHDSPETPEIPKLPSIDYRLFGNPFLKTFEPISGSYPINYLGTQSPLTRPLSIQVNENTPDKLLHQSSFDYSSPLLNHSFTRRLNHDERKLKSMRGAATTMFGNEVENDRHRVLRPPTNQPIDTRIMSSPKLRQDFKVTSFEQPNPRCLHHGLTAFDINSIRRLAPSGESSNMMMDANHQKLYQNVSFVPGGPGIFSPPGQNPMRMFYDNQALKVPAQTQTSIDGGSNNENDAGNDTIKISKAIDTEDLSVAGSPSTARRKKIVRKERNDPNMEKRPLSPAAQRRKLRKQTSINTVDGVEADKIGSKLRKLSPATTTTSEHVEDKNESRSSSSGQESPRKDQNRRVSLYFNSKKRPSLVSVKTGRSASIDNSKDIFGMRSGGPEALDTTNSERERTNSASSREAIGSSKVRKSSVSSGKVPWCACWGNGCM